MKQESALYPPIKAYLESLGYSVKGEVGAADIVALRDGAAPVIVELKLGFSLALYHQAIARLAVTDRVYVAVPSPRGHAARRIRRDNRAMCRRLGLGLIFVSTRGLVEIVCDPGPYAPRKSRKRQDALVRAFDRLRGDPNAGGATRHGLVTGYRQEALLCARHLARHGPTRGRDVCDATGVAAATRIMRDNHYGWFERVSTGVYRISEAGRTGLADWADSGV